jgi:hypothetical protein
VSGLVPARSADSWRSAQVLALTPISLALWQELDSFAQGWHRTNRGVLLG